MDYVIVGEGELPLAELLDALREEREPEGIRGLWKMRNGIVFSSGFAEAPSSEAHSAFCARI